MVLVRVVQARILPLWSPVPHTCSNYACEPWTTQVSYRASWQVELGQYAILAPVRFMCVAYLSSVLDLLFVPPDSSVQADACADPVDKAPLVNTILEL